MSSLSEARNAINQLGVLYRSIANVDAILAATENLDQVNRELGDAISAKRAALAELDAHSIDAATAEGKRLAAGIVAEAEKQAADILGTAKAEAASHASSLAETKVAHDEMALKISALRETAKSLAFSSSANPDPQGWWQGDGG
jgi:regulator of protease activity HflC (stomatin/prohibitin superfamily)